MWTKLTYVLALAAPLAFFGPAVAKDVTGTIESYDADARMILLEDGQEYGFAADADFDDFEVGQQVRLQLEEHDGQEVVTDIEHWEE